VAYKRPWKSNSWNSQSGVVNVNITWDNLTNAGYIFSMKPYIKQKCDPIIVWIKNSIPTTQREYMPETYSWFIGESFGLQLKQIVELMGTDYVLNFVEKPEAVFATKIHPFEIDFERFKQIIELSGVADRRSLDIVNQETEKNEFIEDFYKKYYRKAALRFHPDHSTSEDSTKLMSELNEIWNRLKNKKMESLSEVT